MGGRGDIERIAAEIGRTFEEGIPFNRVLGLSTRSIRRRRGCASTCGPNLSATRRARSCMAA
jgi:hypothetical protein